MHMATQWHINEKLYLFHSYDCCHMYVNWTCATPKMEMNFVWVCRINFDHLRLILLECYITMCMKVAA